FCDRYLAPLLPRKELSLLPTNKHVFNKHCGAAAARARGGSDEKLEALGTISFGTPMGDRSRGLFALRKLLGLFFAPSCAQPRVSLGRGRPAWYFGSTMPPLFRAGALEWKRSDFKRAAFRTDRFGGQSRRGCEGALLLPRFDANPLLHEGALQISPGGISVRPFNRGKSPPRITRARVRTDRHRDF